MVSLKRKPKNNLNSMKGYVLCIHDDINNNNNNNTGGHCCCLYERVYFFLPVLTILCWLPRHVRSILLCLRSQVISAGRDTNWFDLIRSEKFNDSLRLSFFFQNPNILGPFLPSVTSSTHSIHSNCASFPISCLGVYYHRWWLSYPFCVGMRVHYQTMTPEPRDTE